MIWLIIFFKRTRSERAKSPVVLNKLARTTRPCPQKRRPRSAAEQEYHSWYLFITFFDKRRLFNSIISISAGQTAAERDNFLSGGITYSAKNSPVNLNALILTFLKNIRNCQAIIRNVWKKSLSGCSDYILIDFKRPQKLDQKRFSTAW